MLTSVQLSDLCSRVAHGRFFPTTKGVTQLCGDNALRAPSLLRKTHQIKEPAYGRIAPDGASLRRTAVCASSRRLFAGAQGQRPDY